MPRHVPPGTVVFLVAALGLAVVAGAAWWTAPTPATIADLPGLEGARVQVDARVLHARERVLALADDSGRVTAFPPRDLADAPDPGDEVRAVGIVGRSATGLTLSLQEVRVLAAPVERVLAVGDLAASPARYAGAPVTVDGVLNRVPHAGWHLVDPGTGGRVALHAIPVPAGWMEGERVRVDGLFQLHERTLQYRVTVSAWTPS